jgi:hypothetical protein
MAMFRVRYVGAWPQARRRQAKTAVQPSVQDILGRQRGPSACHYESPLVMIIGSVRKLTAGSTASGNKDANSRYYW